DAHTPGHRKTANRAFFLISSTPRSVPVSPENSKPPARREIEVARPHGLVQSLPFQETGTRPLPQSPGLPPAARSIAAFVSVPANRSKQTPHPAPPPS